MVETMKKVKKYLNNLALKKKLLLPIMVILIAFAAVALLAVNYGNRANQELLYRSVASSMEYLALSIEKELDSYMNLSFAILSDTSMQNILSQIKDSQEEDIGTIYAKDGARVKTILENYYYENANENLLYVMLRNPVFTSSTYNMRSSRVPEQVRDDLRERALRENGKPVWVTDYANEYGLFLTRSIRRMDGLKLDELGTIVLAIDVHGMVADALEKILLSNDLLFALYKEDGTVFLCTDEKDDRKMTDVLQKIKGKYGICKTDFGNYFISKGILGENNWGYSFWISYDDIVETLNRMQAVCVCIILGCAVILLVLANRWMSSITRHFNRLIDKMVAFAGDDSQLPDVGYDYSDRKDEIGQMHNQFDLMAEQIISLINDNYKNEILKKDVELKALQNQINPHFLYNTLNFIHWKAKADEEYEISDMVQALGKLLRASLGKDERTHTIEKELEIVHNYITIVKYRYGERLYYEEQIDPNLLAARLPLMTVQPIVENAVYYGLEESIDECEVKLTAFAEEDMIMIEVMNNGTQFGEDFMEKLLKGDIAVHGLGIGMQNIHRRIQMTFGDVYGIRTCDPDVDHAVVQIRIPRESD